MARRIIRHLDEERTELLDQNELFVQKDIGDRRYFYAWLQDSEVETCPLCAGKVIKIQDLFSKTYQELIIEDGKNVVITLEYGFHKYRCLNSECRHIFAKEIQFASKYDKITYRLENRIAQMVMAGHSYGEISIMFQSSITRQAVGQIFNRWVRKKDELRRTQSPPSSIAVLSGMTDRDRYTLVLNLDNGIRIFDILHGVSSSDIAATLSNIGTENIKTVLSDCDATIVETIKDQLPNATHIIPVDYWLKLISDDFAAFSHEVLKWSHISKKDDLIMKPVAELGYRVGDLENLLETRPAIRQPHKDFNDLRAIINRRDEMWVFDELVEWTEGADKSFIDYLSATTMRLHLYQQEIEAHVQHREFVPEQLHLLTEKIESCISKMRTFSAKVLRARVLYSTETDLQNWCGVPIEDAIAALESMNGG